MTRAAEARDDASGGERGNKTEFTFRGRCVRVEYRLMCATQQSCVSVLDRKVQDEASALIPPAL
jgi:hypothetical protein